MDQPLASSPLYRQLAERIAGLVHSGALKRGDRLLSVRETARQQGVSVATVLQAYRQLEDARLVEGRPKSGYFVCARLPKAPPARQATVPARLPEPELTQPPRASQRVDLSQLAEQVLASSSQTDGVSFGAAVPSGELFDGERLRRAMSRAAMQHRHSLTRYPIAPGISPLREAVAQRALGLGCQLAPADILITNGCVESISLCLRAVTRPGDVVALESPTYFGFLQILEALHLRALEIPTSPRTGLSLPALQLALETQPVKAVLAVPTLSNPLGSTMPTAARRQLLRLLREHDLPLIEDVIYNDLHPMPEGRRAVKSFDTTGQVMVCGSYSKTVAPGIRLGWVEGGRWSATLRRLKAALSGGHMELIERLMADVLTQPGYEPALRQLRGVVQQRLAEARQLIAQSFPAGTRVTAPAGGWVLWVELPAGIDVLALYEMAWREHIRFAPGSMFSASERYRHCLRLGLGGNWGQTEQAAMRRIGGLARTMAA